MGNPDEYRHYHEKSSRWFMENFADYTSGGGKDREAHHHKIVELESGQTGEGFGWSYQQAERKAWDDLKQRVELTSR